MAEDDGGAEDGGQTLVRAGRAASVLERYYSSFLGSSGPPYHDEYVIHVHTNKTIVACLAPSHPLIVALRNESSPVHIVRWTWATGASPLIPRFSAETGLAATAAGIAWSSGGGKKPPTKMQTERSTQIATAVTSDGRIWPIRAALQGWLVEINSTLTLGVGGGTNRSASRPAAAAVSKESSASMDVDAISGAGADAATESAAGTAISSVVSLPEGSGAGASAPAGSRASKPADGPTAAARAVTRLLRDTPHAEGWLGIFNMGARQRDEAMKSLTPLDATALVYRRRRGVPAAASGGVGSASDAICGGVAATDLAVTGEGSAAVVPAGASVVSGF